MQRCKCLLILILATVVINGCAQQQTGETTTTTVTATSTTTTTTAAPTPGYQYYRGTDASGQSFTLEYPDSWTASQETLTSTWNSGEWISLTGPGSWETGIPIINLWIVPKGGTLTSVASYNTAAFSDRNRALSENSGPGQLSQAETSETIAGLAGEGWETTYLTTIPFGPIYSIGTFEVHEHYAGDLTSAKRKWLVLLKGNYLYDIGFNAVGNKVATCEAVYLHLRDTFRFN